MGRLSLVILIPTINSLPATNIVFYEEVGFKNYELSNHLGNVLATVTDRKVPDIDVPNSLYNHFNAQITTIADYYPFGMQIEERTWTAPSNKYRFGFNGQEKENEISGNDGGHISYKYSIQDVRLGRFLSVDPLAASYPWNSTYAFAENKVIQFVDLEGLEVGEPGNGGFRAGLALFSKKPLEALAREREENKATGEVIGYAPAAGLAIAFPIGIWGLRSIGIYLAEELGEELAGFPIIPDPGDLVQSQVKKQFRPTKVLPGMPVAQKKEIRQWLATKWMGKKKYTQYIDLNRAVYTRKLTKGEKFIQFRVKGNEGKLGNYYAPIGTKPGEIGLDPDQVTQTLLVTVTKNTKVLFSAHKKKAPYYADKSVVTKGGGIQIFSKELKNNVSVVDITPTP